MRFLQVRVGRFGPLIDASLGDPEPLGRLVAVLGPNEAGKSTIHQLLVSILFGFLPAARDTNPYTPWGGGDIDISADLQLADGRRVTVQRRLAGSPSGHLILESHDVEAIANRDLPYADHLDRRVFSEVYGITQTQLASLGNATWASVQDDLVTGLGAQDLRPPRTVAKQLEDAANRLWRPDQRGKPRARQIEAELAEATAARRQAADRDRELRSVRRELLLLTAELAEAREHDEQARTRRTTLRELVPLRQRLEEVGRLEVGLCEPAALATLPRDPARVWKELTSRVERAETRIANLAEAHARATDAAGSLLDADREILERAEALDAVTERSPLLVEWSERATAAQDELARLDGRIEEGARRVLGGTSLLDEGESLAGRIRSIDAARLSAAMERLDEARRNAASGGSSTAGPAFANPWLLILVGVASLALFAVGLSLARPAIWGIAAATLLAVLGRSAILRGSRPPGDTPRAVTAAEALVREALAPVGIASEEPVRAGLAERVEAVQSLLRDRDGRADEIASLDGSRVELRDRLVAALEGLELAVPPDPADALTFMRDRVADARTRERVAAEASRDAVRIAREMEEAKQELDAAEASLRVIENAVEAAGGLPTEAGLADLAERRESLDHLERLKREISEVEGGIEGARARVTELERTMEGSDLLDVEAAEAVVDELEARVREIESRRSALEERERGLLEWDTVDLIDGRIERLRDELRTVRREHDRDLVLASVLAKAEERFRSERQPGLLRRARTYLDRITAGRYGRILVGDRGAQGDFMLDATHLPEPHRIDEPLSVGTREQVYLSLRLAIAEHLDQGREPMPLLLDEVLASWDPDRRGRVLALLAEEGSRRQVFVFTCHPHIAEEVRALGGTLVDLSMLAPAPAERGQPPAGPPELTLDFGE